MSYRNYTHYPVRSAAILTTSYVAGTIIEDVQDQDQLIVNISFTKGSLTSAEVKVEFANDKKYSLAYDNQTANFTVGATVTGTTSHARGLILTDTDGGTTGTLVLTNVQGTFLDNEPLTDSSGGAAQANGAPTDVSTWVQQTFGSISGGTNSLSLGENAMTATGVYRLEIPIKDRRIKISAKGTGTVTSSSMTISAQVGRV